ncbi:hypothetical protein CPC08DRAFT_717381 [Agrocybe pediades]|nr:hypothetical protein CPC08DRAFT_717381 [Agrocybe pediades]
MSWQGQGWYPPPRYAQPVPDPRAYGPMYPQPPPPQAWYNPDFRLTSPMHTQPQSTRYPNLNPVLADDTTLLRFDTKVKPTSTIPTPVYLNHRHQPAFLKETKHMRIISKSFPWQIDIVTHINVTVEDVWMSVYNALQQPIADSEWGFIIKEKDAKENVEKAMKKRLDADRNAEKVARRIDYLGDCTLFRGLEKDDEYAKKRLLPFSQKCEETWVIKLMS